MSTVATPGPAPQTVAPDSDRFKVGTLTYTKAGLITLFLFLLWGDFCFTLMETVVPNIMPLKLSAIGAPNTLMGVILVTVPSAMAIGINPLISFRSDRLRSKWGRRIPFLAGATPFLVVFLILLGFSDPIGKWAHGTLLGGRFSEMTVMLVVIAVLMICFQFFNLFITSVYYYLFNDVVPKAYLARFMALFRIVGTCAGSAYNYFVLKYAKTHMQEIFLGAGLLYLVAFLMMCWKVREGSYPPPPPYVDSEKGFRGALRTYGKECFTHRFYWFIFLANSCVAMTWASGTYGLIFQTEYMGLDLSLIGKVGGTCGIVSMVLLYPAAMLADKAHPLRILLIGTCLQVLLVPASVSYAMLRPSMSADTIHIFYIALSVIGLPIGTLYAASELPTLMKLFPSDRYGQFCSANAMIRSAALIVSGVACGGFLDWAKRFNPDPLYCYRFISVWNGFFNSCALVFLFLVYREWKKLGGQKSFVPPGVTPSAG